MKPTQTVGAAGSAALMALLAAFPSQAQDASDYPQEPVRVIVPYAPGGATDIIGRVFAQALGTHFKQTFYVENRPGGGQVIGTDFVARAAKNGNTLLFGTVTHAINATLVPKLPYDSLKDFAPVSVLATSPMVCVVPASLKIRSLREFVDAAKAQPNKFSYASSGAGSPGQLAAEAVKHAAGISVVHIPYKGASQTTADLMSGRVQFLCVSPIPIMAQIKDGSLIALAVTSNERSPILPDTPTMREAGLEVPEIQSWYGFFAPAGTPAAIVERISKVAVESLQDPQVKKMMQENGLTPIGNNPRDATDYLRDEIVKWRKMIEAANIKLG
ncbi:MAG: tripartite tricarboxylate transporter substrate binding protein [Pigmentiphaga sp.]|uniref:Bug family tripartite tricarboxylate transporter substrate binding protein n=1 Tax=Pigmentiphaga sp. TaxID=1977564 RepID=UPI0029A49171|nr:tripartite tricarboxylate transporter substrate binding protein [Pigmentiphaga sp.]MDX3907811.1 tripartite tricarboxylate transporter substrate binding protein [Pigmentiphaga sp.]